MFVEALGSYTSDPTSLLLPPPAGSSLALPKVAYTDTCRAIAAHLFKLTAAMLGSCMKMAVAQVQQHEWLSVWIKAAAGAGAAAGGKEEVISPRGAVGGLDVAAVRNQLKQVRLL